MAAKKKERQLTAEEVYDARMLEHREMLGKVLDTYEGRFVVYQVLALGDIYDLQARMPFDQAQAQRKQGRKDLAIEFLTEVLETRPDAYILMQKEAGGFEERFPIETGSEEEQDDD